MEARRRSGNRRMTHGSDVVRLPAHSVESIWGIFGEPDRTKWQWQAPTPRAPAEETSRSALPAWLLQWDTTIQKKGGGKAVEEAMAAVLADERHLAQAVTVEDDIHQAREAIQRTSSRKMITRIAMEFALQFKLSLSLGLVSQEALNSALLFVSEDLRAVYPNEHFTSYQLAFCTHVWDGIGESKVLQPADIDANVMSSLFSLVASLPLNPGVKELAQKILHSATNVQLRHMEHNLTSLVSRWTKPWRKRQKPRHCIKEIRYAESSVREAEDNLTSVERALMTLNEDVRDMVALRIVQEAIAVAKTAISIAIDAIIHLEDAVFPLQASVKGLARTLAKIPAEMLSELLPQWSEQLFKSCKREARHPVELAFLWLCAVARLPNVNCELFIQTWRYVDPGRHLRQDKCSQVILEHWISQKKVAKPAAVRIAFDASIEPSTSGISWSFARLLLALNKQREVSLARAEDLFNLLHKLERPRHIPETLSRMRKLNMKIPKTLFASTVEGMSAYPNLVRQALRIWCLPNDIKLDFVLRPDFVLKLIINLINSPHIPTAQIWELLNIPIYEDMVGIRFQPHQTTPLPQEMIDLMHNMATAFAHSEARPPRVAFRNISQCLHHLRVHNAPVSSDLTRAINHCYITGSILRGFYVGQERLRYCLHLISQVEGESVARKVDQTVFRWRRLIDDKRARERRKANVLRVGPIQ